MQGAWVQSLVKELRYYMSQGQKKQNMKQFRNKFSKDFKDCTSKKKKKQKDEEELKKGSNKK